MEKLIKGKEPELYDETLIIGIQHEEQHQELMLTDIKYILGHNPLFPPLFKEWASAGKDETTENDHPDMSYTALEPGIYKVGPQEDGFAFDNEFPVHRVFLESFEIADRLVTNREYLAFIEDGGYSNFKLWLDDGWNWVNENNIQEPEYWVYKDDAYFEYTLQGLEKLHANLPVTHISYYEADAFARWKGKRLPSEYEWESAAGHLKELDKGQQFEQDFCHTTRQNQRTFIGDCWEWTHSAYGPYPGFQPKKGALGEYNGKFMVNQMVMKGSACSTPKGHGRLSYRNFFHPDKRWMFSGIRLANSL